jgi:ABC-type microcin C transport system permease subunit YejB
MFGGAAEAAAAAITLAAAIPAVPMAVLIVLVVNFTMGSFFTPANRSSGYPVLS